MLSTPEGDDGYAPLHIHLDRHDRQLVIELLQLCVCLCVPVNHARHPLLFSTSLSGSVTNQICTFRTVLDGLSPNPTSATREDLNSISTTPQLQECGGSGSVCCKGAMAPDVWLGVHELTRITLVNHIPLQAIRSSSSAASPCGRFDDWPGQLGRHSFVL